MEVVKVQGHASLQKNLQTGGIVNNDYDALRAAQKRKKAILSDKEKLIMLEEKVNRLENLFQMILDKDFKVDDNGNTINGK